MGSVNTCSRKSENKREHRSEKVPEGRDGDTTVPAADVKNWCWKVVWQGRRRNLARVTCLGARNEGEMIKGMIYSQKTPRGEGSGARQVIRYERLGE